MFRKAFRRDGDADATLLPLVDVVFILVFALATRVTDDPAVTVQLAEIRGDTSQRPTKSDRQLPVVDLTANGRVSLSGVIVPPDQLVASIEPILLENESRVALLRVDRDAKYQDVVTVRKLITAAGINVRELGRLEN